MPSRLKQHLRIALLDDHAAIRHGLLVRLSEERDFNVVGAFSGSQQLMDALAHTPADLLLIDYALGNNDIDGHNLIRLLRIRFPACRIVVTSAHDNQATIALVMQAGAHGFVGKEQDLNELVAAIRIVANGGIYVVPQHSTEAARKAPTQPLDTLATDSDETDILSRNSDLTPREREVLRCYLNGMSVAQIAEKFSRSNKTISTQKQSGYRKLGIRSDAELFKIRYQLDK